MPGTVSVFFDESGQERRYRPDTKYYLLTLVLHNQKDPISGLVESYERSLSESSLPNVPFHAYDLYHRRGGYAGLDFGTRKKLFAKFSGLVRRLPVTYTTFKYRRSEFDDANALSERMERGLVAFVEERLAEFQSFDTVAIYCDGGQNAVRSAIRNTFDETLSVNTAEYKSLRYQDRRLAQVADFCSIELAALRYADHDAFAGARQISGELCAPGAHSHDAGTWTLRLAGLGDLVPEAGVCLQPLSAACVRKIRYSSIIENWISSRYKP